MAEAKRATLHWRHDLVFEGGADGKAPVQLDGNGPAERLAALPAALRAVEADIVLAGVIVGITMQNRFAAKRADRIDLKCRRGARHHDPGGQTELLGCQCHALRVVARAGGDDATRTLSGAQFGHFVVRTA